MVLAAVLLAAAGCSPGRYLRKKIAAAAAFEHNHTGVYIYDLTRKRELAGYNERKYFTPASNTKLFTYYAGVSSFGDSLPGISYSIRNDSLFFEGTGDPSLLHPDLPESAVLDFLRRRPEKLFFYAGNFQDKRYGPGWAWSDYNDYYQPEKSSLPLYANVVRFTGDSVTRLRTAPPLWQDSLKADSRVTGIERDEHRNLFRYSARPLPHGLQQDIPVVTSARLTATLLGRALNRPVTLWPDPPGPGKSYLYSVPADSVYSRLMKASDNLLGEQLMLVYAHLQGLPLNTRQAIEHALDAHLDGLPDPPVWTDGSGLSRYNQLTPRTLVALLEKLYAKVPRAQLFRTLTYGNHSGVLKETIRRKGPFIFAKTGSLSNNFNLSGYLVTSGGRTLAFSIMNNNFAGPSAGIREEVERLLLEVYEKY